MAKNLRALTDSELRYMLDKYSFDVFEDKYIVVKCLSRKTLHEIGKQFALSTPIRKVAISPLAIEMWLEHFRNEVNEIDRKHDNGLISDEQYQEELRKIDKKLNDYERKHRTELL